MNGIVLKRIKKLALRKGRDCSCTRGATFIELRLTAQFLLRGLEKTAARGNGEHPASLSLALSGGFNAALSTGLHSPGSL